MHGDPTWSIPEVRKIIGNDIALVGNVNCGLLQTGTDEECRADVMRALREGMATGRGYVFAAGMEQRRLFYDPKPL